MCKLFLLITSFALLSCGGEVLPKPLGMLRLTYPAPVYKAIETDCSYSFEKNEIAEIKRVNKRGKCWYNIDYPKLKGTLYLSYFGINNNLDSLLRDAQNLTQEHVVKADGIAYEPYIDKENKVYGMFSEVSGDAASQSQFYVTDSIHHFVSGSIYFKAKPNYDSILPAAHYLQNDIRHIMETIRWKK